MLRSLFGAGKTENWADRAKAHRHELREQQELRNEAANGAETKARRRAQERKVQSDGGRKGFGKRDFT